MTSAGILGAPCSEYSAEVKGATQGPGRNGLNRSVLFVASENEREKMRKEN